MTPEQIAATQQVGLATLQQFARQQFAALEQLSAWGLSTTKTAVEDSLAHTHALLNARTPQDAVTLNLAAAPKRIEQLTNDARALLTLALQQREAFDTLAASQHVQTTALIKEWANQGAPAQITDAMKMATDAAHAAYAGWAAFAKQTADFIGAGLATDKPASTPA